MVSMQAKNAYFKAQESTKIHPVKLIHMLYERLMLNLSCACEGLEEGDRRKRGENLSKAIAIITELNCSLRAGDESEPAQFLRSMYEAMVIELAKVQVSEDAGAIKQTQRYVERLKEIWENTAMRENGFGIEQKMGSKDVDRHEESLMPCPSGQEKGDVGCANLCVSV